MTDTDERPSRTIPPTGLREESEPGLKQTLRQQAEQLACDTEAQTPETLATLSPEDLQRIVHELRVHQIKLQMQNEELRRLQLAAQAGGIGVWDWDLATDRIDFDERACALLGMEHAERPLYYADWAERVHPEDLARAGIEQILHHEQSFKRAFRVRWPDDTWHMIASSGRVIRDAGGTPYKLVGVNWDITEEKRTEAALRAGKQQLDMALHAAVMGIWDWEIATGRVAWAGEHGALFGIPRADFGGMIEDVQARVHPDDREQGMAVFRRTVDEGTDFDNTYRVVWPDGSLHWMHSLGKLIRDDDGVPQRIVGTTQNVTERRAAERALRDSEARFEHLAHFDALTGLPNRLLLADRLHLAMAQARRRGQGLAAGRNRLARSPCCTRRLSATLDNARPPGYKAPRSPRCPRTRA